MMLQMLLLVVLVTSSAANVSAQEHKQEEHKEHKWTPTNKTGESVKADTMKCCEEKDKMGNMKASMPMKGETKAEMKAKMEKMKEMKETMAGKMAEKGMKMQTPESKVEKNEPSKDARQH